MKLDSQPRALLSRDFAFFVWLVIIGVVILSAWSAWRTYVRETDRILSQLEAQAIRLSETFSDSVGYTSHLLGHIGNQIAEHKNSNAKQGGNIEYINDLLSTYRLMNTELLPLSTIAWVDPSGEVRASSIVTNSRPINLAARDYMQASVVEPGKLHLGQPVMGSLTSMWSIPAGYGVTDEKGKHVGTLITGLAVEPLTQKLERSLSVDGVSFGILDEHYFLVALSSDLKLGTRTRSLLARFKAIDVSKDMSGMLMTASLFDKHSSFIYYKTLPRLPYIIVVSYDRDSSNSEIWGTTLARCIEFVIIGLLILASLYVFRQRILKPIVELSAVAVAISQGEKPHIPMHSRSHEIYMLSRQLAKVGHYTEKLRKTQDKLTQANELVKNALGYMAHELKTPLHQIMGFSEMVLEEIFEPLGKKNKEYIQHVLEAGKHQQKLIANFLKSAEAQNTEEQLERVSLSLKTLLESRIKLFASLIAEKNITVTITISEDIPDLCIDEVKLGQAFVNFISNGIKYNRPGGSLTIQGEIARYRGKQAASIAFIDTGIGLAQEDMDKIFQRFGRIKSTSTEGIEGTGLGLPYSKEIIEAHGGTIKLSSTPGEGSRFTVIIPITNDCPI